MFKWFLMLVFILVGSNHCVAGYPMVTNLIDAIALSESSGQPLLLVFGAKWCPHCVYLKRDIENGILSKELDGKIVCYIDIDKNKDLKKEYQVTSLPDSRIIIDKKEVSILTGYGESQYKRWLTDDHK